MTDIMLDIETLGNGKNALLVQIGAVYFDRYTGETGLEFKRNINAVDSQLSGGEFDADTVLWWLCQSDEARASIMEKPNFPILEVMLDLYDFIGKKKVIWSHATFDFVIIQETYKRLEIGPLSYKSARDIRTLVDLAGVSYKNRAREGTHHDALADCHFQVGYCVEAFNKLRGDNE